MNAWIQEIEALKTENSELKSRINRMVRKHKVLRDERDIMQRRITELVKKYDNTAKETGAVPDFLQEMFGVRR